MRVSGLREEVDWRNHVETAVEDRHGGTRAMWEGNFFLRRDERNV